MIYYHDVYEDAITLDREMLSAEDQCWDADTLKQLWDEERICYDGAGILPVKVIPRGDKTGEYLIAFGSEDDGTVFFDKYPGSDHYPHSFSVYWLDSVIAQLQEVKRRIAELDKPVCAYQKGDAPSDQCCGCEYPEICWAKERT